MPKLRVQGKRVDVIDKGVQSVPAVRSGLRTDGLNIQRIMAVQIGRVRGATEPVIEEIPDDAVMILHLEGGFKLFCRHDQFREDFPRAAVRDVDSETFVVEPNLGLPAADRVVGTLVLEALEAFDVKPVDGTALALARKFESKLGRDPGLYALELAPDFHLSEKTAAPASGKPALIFVHGTASSSTGSYKSLSSGPTGPQSDFAAQIKAKYGDHIFAFEHKSLTESPVTNALNLAKSLPEDAIVHLVSHSRGGLIGDLLCVGQLADGAAGLDTRAVHQFFQGRPEISQIEELQTVLRQKKVKVERFVRVASPSRGTTLASNRAERWLSVLLDLIGRLPFLQDPVVSTLYEALQDFLMAFAHKLFGSDDLPGLEAMVPKSPLVRLLNFPLVKSTADLSVIAGASAGKSIVDKLKLFPPDRFYGGQHDLIVNTASMDGGLVRTRARLFLDKGSDVNHFHYFLNASTKKLLLAGLTRTDNDDAGFSVIEQKQVSIPDRAVRVATGPRPTVFLLPGIMGSNLSVNGSRVWLDYPGLFFGGMEKLKIDVAGVQAESVFNDFYGRLVEHLSTTHEVIPFPYDWRLSMQVEAKRLAERVAEKLSAAERSGQSVAILGHSMGGLLARVMIAQNRELWSRLIQQPGGRLIMLGTPNGGSHEIVRLLTGQARTVLQLYLIEGKQKPEERVNPFGQFPGLLEMLPRQPDFNFFDPAAWAELKKTDATICAPSKKDLQEARSTRDLLDRQAFDPEHMLYVAGWAAETASELVIEGGKIKFRGTSQGDGRVLWNSGIPAIPTYYSSAEHGDLANLQSEFPAILDLLQTGVTARLPKEAPASVRSAVATFEMPADWVEMLPDERALRASVLGASMVENRQQPAPRIRVSVTHGDLAFAQHTVAVGHYEGDSIVGSEAHLDRHLKGRLTRWNQLGVYPSKLGTADVFLSTDSKDRPLGAIVIGLGRVGELKPKELESTYYNAALKFALSVADCSDDRFRESDGLIDARITSLLVGTMGDAVTVEECVTAILRGIKAANAALEAGGSTSPVLIRKVEFLDLWEDRAIQAARALKLAKGDPDLRDVIDVREYVDSREGGLRRLVVADDDEWWNRLRIAKDKDTEALRFAVITDRARTEVQLVEQDRAVVDRFIQRAISTSRSDGRLAATLFEMLVPNRLKEYAPALRRTVVVVDKESARYPWELLEDRLGRRQRPIAVDCGFIRQLETEDFRETVVHGNEKTALVVGNPQTTKYVDLPGAEREAQEVEKALKGMGVDVTHQPKPDAVSIMNDLHAVAYRILHLAGHGVHEYQCLDENEKPTGNRVSGMVIGDDVFLTTGMICQMRRVPELVFINCCHLGRTDSKQESDSSRKDTRRDDRNRLAANLAVEFIKMGVRAVIAAGWAVDDLAASTFATRFYEYFVNGDTFGDAVQKTRRDTYQAHPGVNTWGAYQCYGDPDYRFQKGDTRRAANARDKSFTLPAQLLVELENLTRQAEVATGERIKSIRQEAEQVVEASPEGWRDRGDVLYTLGCLYGELGEYDEAVKYYEHSARQEKALGLLRGIEQEANMRVRAAVRNWTADKIKSKDACAEIDQAIEKIETVLGMGRTKERLGLLAGAYKRRAIVDDNSETRKQSLEKMTAAYKEAFDKVGLNSEYSALLTNWLGSVTIGRWADPTALDLVGIHAADLEVNLSKGKTKAASDPSFWNAVIEPDCRLIQYLANTKSPDAKAIKAIAALYRKAKDEGGSERKVQSVLEHLDFLVAMARAYFGQDSRLAASLEKCRNYVASDKPLWEDDSTPMPPDTAPERTPPKGPDRRPRRKAAAGGKS